MAQTKIEVRNSRELRAPRRASRPKDDADQGDLRESIRRFGVVQPIIAKPDGEVIVGQRRSEAAKRLGLDVPVIIRDDLRDEIAAWEARLSEEMVHQPWERLDLAEEIRRLYEAHKKRDDKFPRAKLAERLGVSESTLKNYFILAGLPEEVKEKVQRGDLTSRDARTIGDIADLTEREKVKLATKVAEGKIPTGRKLEDEVAPLIRKAPEPIRSALIHHRDTTYEDARRTLARRETKEAEAKGAEHTLHGLAAVIRERFRHWRGALRGTQVIVPLLSDNEWTSIEALILELMDELKAWRTARHDREEMSKAKALIASKPERVVKLAQDAEQKLVAEE